MVQFDIINLFATILIQNTFFMILKHYKGFARINNDEKSCEKSFPCQQHEHKPLSYISNLCCAILKS